MKWRNGPVHLECNLTVLVNCSHVISYSYCLNNNLVSRNYCVRYLDLDNLRSSYMERLTFFREHRNIRLDIVTAFAADN